MTKKSIDKTKPVVAKKGLVIAYIGDGKGKTTAAMGTAVRAAGAGMDVYILQFVKAKEPKRGDKLQPGEWPLSSEINYFRSVSGDSSVGKIDSEQCGAGFVGILGDRQEKDAHIREAIRGLTRAREVIASGKYGLVVLDEILSAVDLKLLEHQDILDLIASKLPDTHLVLTGHEKHAVILKKCDVVTVMQMKKHAYYSGVLAQKGIDY